jgi:rod shape-determining protein MreD
MAGLLLFFAAVGLAAGLHVLGLRLHPATAQFFDPFLVLGLYRSMRQGPALSALAGTVVGLAHDALSGSLYGLHGFATTLAAYITSRMQIRMMIHKLSQVALLLLLASAFHQTLLTTLQFLLVPAAELPGVIATLIKMATTTLFGTAIYASVDRAATWRQQRLDRRRQRPSLDIR